MKPTSLHIRIIRQIKLLNRMFLSVSFYGSLILLLTTCRNTEIGKQVVGKEEVVFIVDISGDAELVSVEFPNPTTGKPDSLSEVTLPKQFRYVNPSSSINISVRKMQALGTLTLTAKLNGKIIKTETTVSAYGEIHLTTDHGVTFAVTTKWAPGGSTCGTHNGNTLFEGPKGGCYYYNSKGNKTYVDRSECNCK